MFEAAVNKSPCPEEAFYPKKKCSTQDADNLQPNKCKNSGFYVLDPSFDMNRQQEIQMPGCFAKEWPLKGDLIIVTFVNVDHFQI